MTIARACHPPVQVFRRRLAGRWWIAQHPSSGVGVRSHELVGLPEAGTAPR